MHRLTVYGKRVASSTSHILLCRGATKLSPKFIAQKMEAIRLINEELRVVANTPSDTVIMAVTAMVIIEVGGNLLRGTPLIATVFGRHSKFMCHP